MNAKEYIDTYGEAEAKTVAEKAGTNLDYFKQIATGFRKPSPRLAKKLEIESVKIMTRHDLRPDIYDKPASDTEIA